jgi:hypothetical protein
MKSLYFMNANNESWIDARISNTGFYQWQDVYLRVHNRYSGTAQPVRNERECSEKTDQKYSDHTHHSLPLSEERNQ